MLRLLTILTIISYTHARIAHDARKNDEAILGDMKIAYEIYKECSNADMSTCLKGKLAKALKRLSRNDELSIIDGVKLVKDDDVKETQQDEFVVSRGLNDDSALDSIIMNRILGFFKTHTLQIKLPTISESSVEEGRGRRRRIAPLLLVPLLIGGTLVPLAFGALALLAGKALIVSKLALVLAGIIGLKKLLSNGGGNHEAHEVVVQSGHGGPGWGRNIQEAQDMAYSGHKQ